MDYITEKRTGKIINYSTFYWLLNCYWLLTFFKKKGQKEETKYSKTPAPTEENPGDIPYIIATNQNIYIPANYPLLQFKPDK